MCVWVGIQCVSGWVFSVGVFSIPCGCGLVFSVCVWVGVRCVCGVVFRGGVLWYSVWGCCGIQCVWYSA